MTVGTGRQGLEKTGIGKAQKKNAATNECYGGSVNFWRYRADSNRCSRFCRPVPNPSATIPYRLVGRKDKAEYSKRASTVQINFPT